MRHNATAVSISDDIEEPHTITTPAPGLTRSTGRRNRWAELVLAGVSLVVTLVIAVGIAEYFVRQRERTRSTVPGTMPTMYYQHERLLHALVRNYDYFGWAHVGPQGFRGIADVPVRRTAGTIRVMAIGSSTTFDIGVTADSNAWPARLERLLNAQLAPAKVEVINAGVPGYSALDDLIRLQTDLYRYQPDLIIFYEGHNDLFGTLRRTVDLPQPTDRPDVVVAATPWAQWLARHSLLYDKLLSKGQVLTRVAKGHRLRDDRARPATRFDSVLADGARDFERNVRSFVLVAKSLGLPVVIPQLVFAGDTTAAHGGPLKQEWSQAVPYTNTAHVLDGYAQFNRVLRRVAEQESLHFIPTEGFGLQSTSFYAEGDPIHFNDSGARRMAEKLAEALIALKAIPGAPAAVEKRAAMRTEAAYTTASQ